MNNYEKNIDLSRLDFPTRLRNFREERHLSQSDLAKNAGVTYRTVHDLELGKRGRSQAKTLLLLAKALDLSLQDLLGRPENESLPEPQAARRRFPSWNVAVSIGIALAFVSIGLLWQNGRANAVWTLADGRIEARDGIFGIKLWEPSFGDVAQDCVVSPWNPKHLLISTARSADADGRLYCLERATGKPVWFVEPDIAAMVRAYGEEVVMSAKFSCRAVGAADLQGDGIPEFVVRFSHGKFYPYAICTVGADGVRQSQYGNKGHLFDVVIADIDGDGKDEIIATGVNNAVAYQGATVIVLDDLHRYGAAIDALCSPESSEPDSARVRLVLPQFPAPYMDLLQWTRMGGWDLQVYRNQENVTMLSIDVGAHDELARIIVQLDADLKPLGAVPKDRFMEKYVSQWPDSLKIDTGPGDPVWLAHWLSGYQRFEAGHWPPH